MLPELITSSSHLVFHHLGLAVACPEEAMRFLSTLGYQVGETVFDPEQNVNLIMCNHEIQPAIEIIWPGNSEAPVHGLTGRHRGGVVYHVGYATDDLAAALAELENASLHVVCVSPPKRRRFLEDETCRFTTY